MIGILISVFFLQTPERIKVTVNDEIPQESRTVFITQDDRIQLSTEESGYWMSFLPILKEYDNLANGTGTIEKIEYRSELLSSDKSSLLDMKLSPGTHHISFSKSSQDTAFSTNNSLSHEKLDVVQIVVRENNSYVGFLTELIGIPFVLPPKVIRMQGHQTDLRLGTDCAELAIYGMRRMGYKIPYCGPRRILEYLERSNELKQGAIIHFGYQVSVLYEDRGKIGVLDSKDLLIHAYQDRVAIEEFGNTELIRKEYRLYVWKELTN